MRTLAIVPARGGSKGLPGKNIRPFAGQPLLVWSVHAARDVPRIDTVAVSSDSDEALDIASGAGAVPVKRPDALANDTALPKDAVIHCLEYLSEAGHDPFDVVVLLQPTSPLREPGDIEACLDQVIEQGHDSCATFKPTSADPSRTWHIRDGRPEPSMPSEKTWQPRQNIEPVYVLNGAVYAVKVDRFLADPSPAFLFGDAASVIMPEERSFDIDTLLDFELAEHALAFLRRRGGAIS